MAEKFAEVDDELCDVEDGLDAVSDDLCEVEEALYELEDDDDEYKRLTCSRNSDEKAAHHAPGLLRAVGVLGPQGGGWRTGHGRSAVQWYASRGVPSRTWIVPQGRKPFSSSKCCMVRLSAWVSARHSGKWPAVVRSTAEETVCPAVPGQTVDGEVGGVVPPGTLYPGIGGSGYPAAQTPHVSRLHR